MKMIISYFLADGDGTIANDKPRNTETRMESVCRER